MGKVLLKEWEIKKPAMLKVEKLSVKYGYVSALKEVSIEVNQGEIVCLIGGNGAGKLLAPAKAV